MFVIVNQNINLTTSCDAHAFSSCSIELDVNYVLRRKGEL
jgi:hypothetical protein